MYPIAYSYASTGHSKSDGRCPVCGSIGECPDGAPVPMPYPPIDISDELADQSGPLRFYTVTVAGNSTVMRLNDSDADCYGGDAILIP